MSATSDPRYKTSAWRATRLRVLDRDDWRCMAVHEGCRHKAPGALRRAGPFMAHVHHIIDPAEGGDFWDENNLMSVCRPFNIAERNRRQNIRAAQTVAEAAGQETDSKATGPSRKW